MSQEQPKILVIDDDKDTLQLIEMVLGSQGYLVDLAKNSDEGSERLKEKRYDLVLLDLVLGDEKGEDFAESIRLSSVPGVSETKIFFFSGESPERLQEATFSSLSDGYLSKVQGVEVLVETINSLLGWNPTLSHA